MVARQRLWPASHWPTEWAGTNTCKLAIVRRVARKSGPESRGCGQSTMRATCARANWLSELSKTDTSFAGRSGQPTGPPKLVCSPAICANRGLRFVNWVGKLDLRWPDASWRARAGRSNGDSANNVSLAGARAAPPTQPNGHREQRRRHYLAHRKLWAPVRRINFRKFAPTIGAHRRNQWDARVASAQ